MTPDFLRGEAVAQIVGCMHTRPQGGSWSLEGVQTVDGQSTMIFAIGFLNPDFNGNIDDNRPRVKITVKEIDATA